jgi:hypothetical protein
MSKQAPRPGEFIRILQQPGGSFGVTTLAVVLQQRKSDDASAGETGAASLAAAFGHTWRTVAFHGRRRVSSAAAAEQAGEEEGSS